MIDQQNWNDNNCESRSYAHESIAVNEDSVLNTNDPLSTALTTIKLRAFISVALDAGGDWAVDFPAYEGLTLNVVQKGEGGLSVGKRDKVRLRSGDCFLLMRGAPFTLASDSILAAARPRGTALHAR